MPRLRRPFSRQRNIARIRDKLVRTGSPRLVMSLLVALTGGAGFVASYLLLKAGIEAMWLRYLVAVAFAYGVFLLLLRLWIQQRLEELLNLDFSGFPSGGRLPDPADIVYAGKGGQFGGGGASSGFDGAATKASVVTEKPGVLESVSLGDAAGAVAEADELAIPIAIAFFAAALLLSSLFVVYTAPTLMAEVLLDGVLAAGLYRRLRGIDRSHWLETAVRRTIWPFVLTALCLAAAGWAMQWYAPGSDSIGDVFRYTRPA